MTPNSNQDRRGALRKASRLLKFVRGLYPTVYQGQDKEIQIDPAALVTRLRHVQRVYEPLYCDRARSEIWRSISFRRLGWLSQG